MGISRHEFYYELRWWEVMSIMRGYNRRHRHPWSIARWQTYNLMLAQCGSDALQKAGISSASDLLPFPWDKEMEIKPEVTDEDVENIQAEIDALNGGGKP